jgi:hypothetical protein
VAGFADLTEGNDKRRRQLSNSRGERLAVQLKVNGVPGDEICLVKGGGSNIPSGGAGARVEMEIICEASYPALKLLGCRYE